MVCVLLLFVVVLVVWMLFDLVGFDVILLISVNVVCYGGVGFDGLKVLFVIVVGEVMVWIVCGVGFVVIVIGIDIVWLVIDVVYDCGFVCLFYLVGCEWFVIGVGVVVVMFYVSDLLLIDDDVICVCEGVVVMLYLFCVVWDFVGCVIIVGVDCVCMVIVVFS